MGLLRESHALYKFCCVGGIFMGNPFFIFYVDMVSSQDILVLQTSSPEKRLQLGISRPVGM